MTADANTMVETQIAARGIKAPEVLTAMKAVRRDLFVPENHRIMAYTDQPLPIGHGQTISQPYIVARMTELLEVEPGNRILEIGTGCGYQAAVLSRLTDHVYTIEISQDLARKAGQRFHDLGYKTIRWKCGDGYYGWEGEYFDRIIVTAAAPRLPPPLIKQLSPEGRMVIPMGGRFQNQYLTLIIKNKEGRLSSVPVLSVRFVPFTGAAMRRERR